MASTSALRITMRGTRPSTGIRMTRPDDALYHLLSWLSPAYPVGAFAHSSGIEWAVEAGWITDRSTLETWLGSLLVEGAGWNDAVLFTFAHRAASAQDHAALCAIAELAAAAQPSLERRIETLSQGAAFRRVATATMEGECLGQWGGIREEETAYPVAVAIVAAGQAIGLSAVLTAYLHGFVANLVSAAQRLMPLGQTEAQRVIAALRSTVLETVGRATRLPDGDPFAHLGSSTFLADVASMRHETQYTRLFRT